MASIFLGANRGADLSPDRVTSGSSTGSTDVELRIDTGKSLTRREVKEITDALVRRLEDQRYTSFTL